MESLWQLLRRFGPPYFAVMLLALVVMGSTAGLNALAIKRLEPVFRETFGALERESLVERAAHAVAARPDVSQAVRAAARGVLQFAAQAEEARRAAHMRRIWNAAVKLVLTFFAAAIAGGLSSYLMAFVGQRFVSDIRRALFVHLERLDLKFFERQPVGELISRVTNDTRILQRTFSGQLANLIVGPLSAIVMLYFMAVESWRLSLLMALAAPTILGITRLLGAGVRRHGRRAQARMADLSSRIYETFAAVRIVKTYNLERTMARRFEDENQAVVREYLRLERLRAASRPLSGMLAGAGIVAVLVLGAHEILQGRLTAAGLMTFLFLAVQAGNFISKFTQQLISLHQADAAASRVMEVLSAQPEPPDPPDAVDMHTCRGEIEFDAVTFGYDADRPVLREFSLRIRPGEHLAIVGPSGAGKSTVANLIARLYDPVEGAVRVDGVDLRRVKRASYRRHIALVPQETVLFTGTVRENIAFGRPDATMEEIIEAAKAAQAHEFIMRLPKGYDTELTAMGQNLSGGQRQRIAIARALLRRPAILVLDEATSALDRETEAAVQRALWEKMAGRTMVIIAHRLSTIRDADRIVVMLDGRIVEEGDHRALLAAEGVYHRLYHAQAQAQAAVEARDE